MHGPFLESKLNMQISMSSHQAHPHLLNLVNQEHNYSYIIAYSIFVLLLMQAGIKYWSKFVEPVYYCLSEIAE
jgi:hypothetical protein